jgi:NhaP-type Na+/H+ or K+/H+ antiporter
MTLPEFVHDPAFNVGLALAVGMLAQALARHLRIPGIVLLLAAGVVLGPDLLGIVRPESLGEGLQLLVGFAVAVILFEGGMNLNLRRLRREAVSIRRLSTWGALVTAAGAALAARLVLGWDWTLAALFGTLVIVTGPTVINPLLRRIRVNPNLATVLEAEGVLVDAIGAIVAVVALEVALSPSGESLAMGGLHVLTRLGFGALLGAAAGLLLALLLRSEHWVPEGLENVFTLSIALALFQISNGIMEESGIVTVTAAGLVVGNVKTRALSDLREFKEQLTVLLIGMLFVLLAADVRMHEVQALGWRGAATVAVLMFVVRPLNIAAGTWGSGLPLRDKAFLSWLAPRGIVAAAVSSLFADKLGNAGIEGGGQLRALVFLVIAVTVLVQGLTGGAVARLLGVRRASNLGQVVLGATPLGLALGRLLRRGDSTVIFLDANPQASRQAEAAGFRVFYGNALAEAVLMRADLDGRAGAIAMTANEGLNMLFARKAREEYKVPIVRVALASAEGTVTPVMVREIGARVLFGRPRNLDLWRTRLARGGARVRRWRLAADSAFEVTEPPRSRNHPKNFVLPLALEAADETGHAIDDRTEFRRGAVANFAILEERREEAEAWLAQAGWVELADEPPSEGAAS